MVRLLLFFLLASIQCLGQIQVVGLPRSSKTTATTARTKATELTLPFWDDFSFATTETPDDSLWLDGANVWVNDGLGINPPSIRVATFDGTDGTGKPYNVNDVLAKGYADKLESQVIRLDQVDPALRTTVYLSFFYQMKGRGELPDLGDVLILQFKNADAKWETVWSRENDGTLSAQQFYQVIVPIAEERFYHNTFQFRLQNFARLSGPYDTWHVDYIYLNKGRSDSDLSYPDRALASNLGSIFETYHAIPKKHFFEVNPALIKPSFVVYNLRLDNNQPLNYFTFASVDSYSGETKTSKVATLDNETSIGSVAGGEFLSAVADANGLADMLDESADSINIRLKLGLRTKDNLVPAENGDYDEARFSPIDFRFNDTLRSSFWLSSYYAYDDGTAEYGAALNQPGAQLAYEFNRIGTENDSLAAIEFFFPRFGDESSQVIEIRVWSALSDNPDDVLYKEVVTLQRSSQNVFWRKKLAEAKKVPPRFYIGWKQSTAAVIAIGLDKNSNTGNKMYFNTIGTWEQNVLVEGNLMLRPVFGKGKAGPNTGLEDSNATSIFPNPSKGTFYVSGRPEQVQVFDLTGRPMNVETTQLQTEMEVRLSGAAPGLYIVKSSEMGKMSTNRLVVRP